MKRRYTTVQSAIVAVYMLVSGVWKSDLYSTFELELYYLLRVMHYGQSLARNVLQLYSIRVGWPCSCGKNRSWRACGVWMVVSVCIFVSSCSLSNKNILKNGIKWLSCDYTYLIYYSCHAIWITCSKCFMWLCAIVKRNKIRKMLFHCATLRNLEMDKRGQTRGGLMNNPHQHIIKYSSQHLW